MVKGENRKGQSGFPSVLRMAAENKETIITGSLVLYAAVYIVIGMGGVSFQLQPAQAYVQTTSNSNCPAGAMWVEGNDLHWCDGSTEYWATDESGDRIDLIDGSSSGPSGAVWIEGSDFHWIDAQDDEFSYNGVDTGNNPSGASPGNVWIEGGYIHYIDANGNERTISS